MILSQIDRAVCTFSPVSAGLARPACPARPGFDPFSRERCL